jgi:hypothetical protein
MKSCSIDQSTIKITLSLIFIYIKLKHCSNQKCKPQAIQLGQIFTSINPSLYQYGIESLILEMVCELDNWDSTDFRN